jgi:hypothetical protein
MRRGPTEIGHHAVTKVLRDMSAEALDGLRRSAMILANDLTPRFGIEMAGNLGRTHEIAEKYRQMAAFSCGYTTFNSDGCIGIILCVRSIRRLRYGGATVATETRLNRGFTAAFWAARDKRAPAPNAELLTRGILEVAA